MTEKEEKELDEKIEKLCAEMEKETNEREKETNEREKEEKELDEKIEKLCAEMEKETNEREKEEKELDEKIEKLCAEMEKETNEREKEIAEWEASEGEWELDEEEANQLLKDTLIDINAPFCHYIKPDGVAGKEFMIEMTMLRHCVGCNDEEQCWSVGQLKDLIIEEEGKTFLNQDY